MVKRYFIKFAYDGTNYHGWQVQPNAISVQEVMTNLMSRIFGSDFKLVAAGRTDAGVHAKVMYAHFDTDKVFDCFKLTYKLNNMFPGDISVYGVYQVKSDAHARFDAISRTYDYVLSKEKDIFNRFFYSRITFDLDVQKMNEAAKLLLSYTDFTSFSKLHTDVKTNNCDVMKAFWHFEKSKLIFTIKADRFLRNMVRAIVGTLLEVGKGKITEKDFCKIIEDKNRCKAGTSVNAEGLFLVDIEYPEDIFEKV